MINFAQVLRHFSSYFEDRREWMISTNVGLVALACLLFLMNQMLEFFFMLHLGIDYNDLCAWDCGWYKNIVDQGYDLVPGNGAGSGSKMDQANWAFFPLFPLLVKLFCYLTGSDSVFALMLMSRFFFLLAIFAFMKFCEDYAPNVSKPVAGTVVAFNPLSIYGNVGYTEPLFLLLTCISFCLLKRKKYLASGVSGAFLSATRLVGILFVISYVIASFRDFLKAEKEQKVEMILGFLLIPLGLVCFILFLYNLTGDGLAFGHIQKAWHRVNSNPFLRMWDGFSSMLILPRYLATPAIIAVLLCVILWLRKYYELAVFSLLSIVIPATSGLISLPRFIWWQAPLLMLLALAISKNKFFSLVFLLLFYGMFFVIKNWSNAAYFLI
jgi:hypothetical protein